MRKRTLITFAATLLVSVALHAQTVDEILDKNAAAKGGWEKLRALKSVRMSGKMQMGGMEAPFVMVKSRPEQVRMEFTVQGMTGIQSYDGSTGWMVMPFMGKKDPEQMSGDMLKDLKEQADFDGPMVDYAKKGNKVELLGKEEIEGTPAYKLKLTTKAGDETIVFVDAESFLEIKMQAKRKIQGQEIEAETSLGNYQEFGGMLFPTSIEMKPKGAPAGQTITIDKIELNPTLAGEYFAMPKAAKAEVKQ
ncbi:MAG TPA: outer membrane lipoprotein-sorting protein [Thermoanaerobaculia bacterium]|jgi:outer membrane lipoprotein-sorting protein